MKKVRVVPKSAKAKNRLANSMCGEPECIVEQHVGNKVFLAAANRKYFFWVNLVADVHWGLEE